MGTALQFVVCPITELTHLVTEQEVPEEELEPYRAAEITVIRA